MNRLLIKLEFFFYFFKSKILKKNIFTAEEINTLNFKKKISEYKFKDFWFLNNVEIINYFLPKFKDVKFDYLEIGSHEGMSLLYVLENYKNVSAIGIDVWSGKKYSLIEKIFDKNIFGYKNFLKIKKDSIIALREFNHNNFFFDYIYIDGLHLGEHVIVDAIESFKVLKNNGIMIFDDFLQFDASRKYQTYQAIFYFLKFFKKNLRILYFQNILVIKKIKS